MGVDPFKLPWYIVPVFWFLVCLRYVADLIERTLGLGPYRGGAK